jgi:arylsulfatase A-like enzyme
MRVPCLVRWKGTIPEGLISNNLVSTIDIFPTVAELLELKSSEHKIDGVSFLPILKGDVSKATRKEFYYYYRKNNLEAVRWEDWKLVLPHPGRTYENFKVGKDGFPGDTNEDYSFPKALYDLRRDPGERYNVIGQFPEMVRMLDELAEKAREDLGDDLTLRVGKNVRQVGQKK